MSEAGGYRRLLRNRRFRRLWVSQFVSGIGDWLVIGFLMPLVSTLSGGSSFAVAGILIAKIVPALFLSSVTGVFVDRFDRRRLMIATDLVRAALTLLLLATNSLALIYLTVLLMETASLFFFPAKSALIPALVAEEDVTAANGLSYTTQQASMLIGLTAATAILAGFEAVVRLILNADLPIVSQFAGLFAPALLGPRAGVFVNSLSFLFSAALITSIRVGGRSANHDGSRFDLSLIGRDVIESFRFLRDHRELRGLLVTIGMAILGGGTIIPVGLVYIQTLTGGVPFVNRIEGLQHLAAAPQTFMLVFLALGMVGGALFVPRLASRLPLTWLFAGSVAAFGVSMVG
ncbi:MAG: MFS transporter, partial [Actinomycetota bacterium]|nr:MFS transporter [Actinomycetota bacterium]